MNRKLSEKILIAKKRLPKRISTAITTIRKIIFKSIPIAIAYIASVIHVYKRKLIYKVEKEIDRDLFTDCKVILIGIDGASWDIVIRHNYLKYLPNISALVKKGAYGHIRTLSPTLSPRIWGSIATGKIPEKHGITSFLTRNQRTGRMVPYTSNMRKTKTIWNILSDYDKTVGIIGWWNTWPAETVNGFIVSGIVGTRAHLIQNPALNQKFDRQTFPKEIFNEITHFIRPLKQTKGAPDFIKNLMKVNQSKLNDHTKKNIEALVNILNIDKNYADIGEFLQEKYDTDLFAIYFAGLDEVAHRFWIYIEPEKYGMRLDKDDELYTNLIRDYYIWIDSQVGRLIHKIDDNTVVVLVSDHGLSASQDLLYMGISAIHTKKDKGMILFYGKNIKENYFLKDVSILDVTPTILKLLGFPIGIDMDGKVLKDIFEVSYSKTDPIRYIDTYDKELPMNDKMPIESSYDDEVIKRLRSLGYID